MKDARHHPKIKIYLMVFSALLVLTVVTVLVSYYHLPPGPAIGLGLLIACVKAGLVAAFFMHLKGERQLIYGILGLTAVFVAILYCLPSIDSLGTAHQRIPEAHAGEAPSESAH